MKTKQTKEESDRSIDEESSAELTTKTRAQKKAADEEQNRAGQDELPKTSKEPALKKSSVNKPTKTIVKKKALGIRKNLRNKKVQAVKDKLKTTIKQASKRGRKPAIKIEPILETEPEKDTVQLIPSSEIKKEPLEETSPNSRSSSPKTAGKRQRLSSDMLMMKTLLGDSPTTLVLGPRTSPYSMRSERSNSPSTTEGKGLRSGKPRKLKTNLLNEAVKNEQRKRRLLSDSKTDQDCAEELKKRGRSHSRDGSEISKCSDITESDLSLSETVSNDADGKADTPEISKKVDNTKTDLDVDNETSIPISTINTKVPFNDDTKVGNISKEMQHTILSEQNKKKSLKRSTSLDSDNNNSRSRFKLDSVQNSSDNEDKSKLKGKTDKDALLKTRSSILNCMSKTFNSKEVSKNIRKARRGRKRVISVGHASQPKNGPSLICGIEPMETGQETIDSLSNEIKDLISTLEDEKPQNDSILNSNSCATTLTEKALTGDLQAKSASKFYGIVDVKPLTDNNTITVTDTCKDARNANNNITGKINDSENIRLHNDEDLVEKSVEPCKGIDGTYPSPPVASIDKLMDRLKVFEEFDKKRQSEQLMKTSDTKTVMVTNDVVLIPKSGADIKPLKDIQTVRSPEKPTEKENVLSCFENNSAISIVKRDHVRKSIDIDTPNTITVIKRNSIHSRKASTGSNHSRESNDAISIFEKSLGKDVTLTEIRKSVDKCNTPTPVDVHQLATLHPNSSNPGSPTIIGLKLDSTQVSITPRTSADQVKSTGSCDAKKKSNARDSLSIIPSEIAMEWEKLPGLEKITLATQGSSMMKSATTKTCVIHPVAIKSHEAQQVDSETLARPHGNLKILPEISSKSQDTGISETSVAAIPMNDAESAKLECTEAEKSIKSEFVKDLNKADNNERVISEARKDPKSNENTANTSVEEIKPLTSTEKPKLVKSSRSRKSSRSSLEGQPGPSNILSETPESQQRKENILRTLGLLTHKAASEAKIEKQKEKERAYAKTFGPNAIKNKGPKSSCDYTGTLKTVIKLNRGTGEKGKRSSLKMTFQKSKNRTGKPVPELGETEPVDTFYTIERREGVASTTTGVADGPHRKSYSNRFNNDPSQASVSEPTAEVVKEASLVIPEKASSFSIHPGRLCRDQCCYCGGNFGLFDTPCHIAQMKSAERQKKVLDNEEKLTIDSCLCDACYRHVDRRANCPSYRRRPLNKVLEALPGGENATVTTGQTEEKPVSPPGAKSVSALDESEEEAAALTVAGRPAICHTTGCGAVAGHAIRRKWLIKMRTRVNSVLKLQLDYPGLHTIPLCSDHHRALQPLMQCALCRRTINKHHNLHFVKHSYQELNPLLEKEGVPVQFTERPVLCKMCRYYCTLLQRPGYNDKHAKAYRIRLLQSYNIEVPPEEPTTIEETKQENGEQAANIAKQKKKNKVKTKQRKSSDQFRSNEELITEPIVEIREGTENLEGHFDQRPMEEDIESLISSNKILVPSKPSSGDTSTQSDTSDPEMTMQDMDGPIIPLDKQTELQYLLQKQNNPAQFLHKPVTSLTHKQKSLFRTHNVSIQKSGQQHRIFDKNSKRLHNIGQALLQKEKMQIANVEEPEMSDVDKMREGAGLVKNITLNDECTIESIPPKKPTDINTLKNKWQMSESFTQVKKNISELSRKLSVDKEPKRSGETKFVNPVKRLETNPSISVRELFPGEDEMNLQCNIEFNTVKGVTPEGWEKCNTTIQYDVETKKLWNELQRPYGNTSSFLRHLILLEKYFRSGDLVLTHNATPNAINYSDAVQSRLRAYDNIPADLRRSESMPEVRKKLSMNSKSKSLLKVNQNVDKAGEIKKPPPPGTFLKPKPKPPSEKTKSKQLPPELIAISPNIHSIKSMQNALHNIQQLVKGVSASDPTEVATAPLSVPKLDPPSAGTVKVEISTPVIKKQKTTSKPWRPTLMPITPENLARIEREPTQVAVDGRNLPSLVQVMSSGQRYHITIQDYNKMCIMRREKLQQLNDGEKPKKVEPESLVTEIQPSALLGNGGSVKFTVEKPPEMTAVGTAAASMLKSVGLKNITIAPVPAKPSTVTSQTAVKLQDAIVLSNIPKCVAISPQFVAPAPPRP